LVDEVSDLEEVARSLNFLPSEFSNQKLPVSQRPFVSQFGARLFPGSHFVTFLPFPGFVVMQVVQFNNDFRRVN
jgi:hypothetical protein